MGKRYDIFEEGMTQSNGATVLLGSTVLPNRVPVLRNGHHDAVLGWAYDFERDETSHMISAEMDFIKDFDAEDLEDFYDFSWYSTINADERVYGTNSWMIQKHTIRAIYLMPTPGIPRAMAKSVVEKADQLDKTLESTAAEDIGVPADFLKELTHLINKHSMENGSNTPDYILAEYLCRQLVAYNVAAKATDAWHSGR